MCQFYIQLYKIIHWYVIIYQIFTVIASSAGIENFSQPPWLLERLPQAHYATVSSLITNAFRLSSFYPHQDYLSKIKLC